MQGIRIRKLGRASERKQSGVNPRTGPPAISGKSLKTSILSTKIAVPEAEAGWVERPRLLELLGPDARRS